LAGHLTEMMEASNTSAQLEFDAIPILNKEIINYYLEKGCIPGGTKRNYASYGHKMEVSADNQLNILCDPQTSGGLLIAVDKLHVEEFILFANENGFQYLKPIGTVIDKQIKRVSVF
jgi:selenide,water dikinase